MVEGGEIGAPEKGQGFPDVQHQRRQLAVPGHDAEGERSGFNGVAGTAARGEHNLDGPVAVRALHMAAVVNYIGPRTAPGQVRRQAGNGLQLEIAHNVVRRRIPAQQRIGR